MIFDVPGIDPTWNKLQPNDYARLIQNNGIYPAASPNRTEYYLPESGGSEYTVTNTWDGLNDAVSISDRFYTPNQRLLGIPALHSKGYIGTGVKIMLFGDGYSNSSTHEAIGTLAVGAVNTYLHDVQVLGTMVPKPEGVSKLIGSCYGSTFYSRRITNVYDDIDYARSLGIKIIVLCHDTGAVNAQQKAAIKAFYRTGGIIIASAGNGGSLGSIQAICGEPGVVSVGTTVGGTVLSFQDVLYSRKIQAVSGTTKTIDFAIPAFTTTTFHGLDDEGNPAYGSGTDKYKVVAGSSFTAPQVAGLFACLMQIFPTLSGKIIYYMVKHFTRTFTQDSIVIRIPEPFLFT